MQATQYRLQKKKKKKKSEGSVYIDNNLQKMLKKSQ